MKYICESYLSIFLYHWKSYLTLLICFLCYRKTIVRRVRKLNPLRNTRAMLKLNPFAAVLKRKAILADRKLKLERAIERSKKEGVCYLSFEYYMVIYYVREYDDRGIGVRSAALPLCLTSPNRISWEGWSIFLSWRPHRQNLTDLPTLLRIGSVVPVKQLPPHIRCGGKGIKKYIYLYYVLWNMLHIIEFHIRKWYF